MYANREIIVHTSHDSLLLEVICPQQDCLALLMAKWICAQSCCSVFCCYWLFCCGGNIFLSHNTQTKQRQLSRNQQPPTTSNRSETFAWDEYDNYSINSPPFMDIFGFKLSIHERRTTKISNFFASEIILCHSLWYSIKNQSSSSWTWGLIINSVSDDQNPLSIDIELYMTFQYLCSRKNIFCW